MYSVSLIYNDQETIIHDDRTPDPSNPRVTGGTITKAINEVDRFTFRMYPNNPGYDKIQAKRTKITVKNTDTGAVRFEGRVNIPKLSMDARGLICSTVDCEGMLAVLKDSVQPYREYYVPYMSAVVNAFLSTHNTQMQLDGTTDKTVRLGTCDVVGESNYHYVVNYVDTLSAMGDKLINRFGGEFAMRSENGQLILDYLNRIGEQSPTAIELGVNLKTLAQISDASEICTVLYPLGERDADGKYLTIADANSGLDYLMADSSLISQYGIKSVAKYFDDVTTAEYLKTRGQKWLNEQNKIRKQYQITALDLGRAGYRFDAFELGNTHRVINTLMGIDEQLRIVKISEYIDAPWASTLYVGDKLETISQMQARTNRTLYKIN